jgi:hypothetical protein
MAIMDAATRSAVQAELLASLFSGTPPDPSEILPKVEAAAVERGYSLAESALQPWGRKLELELGALSGCLARRMGQVPGLNAGNLDLAQRAVSSVMALRGQGFGPDSWKLWLNQDFTWDIAESVATRALAGSPLASIVGSVRELLQTAAEAEARKEAEEDAEDEEAWSALDEEEDEEPVLSGTGSFGAVAFEVSADKVKTWNGLNREHKGRYAKYELIGVVPRSAFNGPDVSQTTCTVRLDVGLGAAPAEDMEEFADMCRKGRVEPLILGGRNLGPHYLESVKETWRHTGPGGAVLVAEVDLTFQEYA